MSHKSEMAGPLDRGDTMINKHFTFYAPGMIMIGALSVTPVHPYVRTYVRTYVLTYVCPDDGRSQTQIFFIRIL